MAHRIVEELSAVQDAAKLSSRRIALAIGIDPSMMSHYRKGDTTPSLPVAAAWAEAAGAALKVLPPSEGLAADLATIALDLTIDEAQMVLAAARALLAVRADPVRAAIVGAGLAMAAREADVQVRRSKSG